MCEDSLSAPHPDLSPRLENRLDTQRDQDWAQTPDDPAQTQQHPDQSPEGKGEFEKGWPSKE